MNKLLLICPNSIHLWKYYSLIKDSNYDILIMTDQERNEKSPRLTNILPVTFILRRPWVLWQSVKKIRDTIGSWQPDLVHAHQAAVVALTTLWAARPFSLPVVVTAWGSDILQYGEKNLLYRLMIRFILRRASAFTADSLNLATKMQEIAGARKLSITVANFGVEVDPGEPLPKENIIYSNRLHNDLYRIDTILRQAAKFFQSQSDAWRVIIGGIGPDTAKLQTLAQSLGIADRVEFTGWVEEDAKISLYRRAKIFVSIPRSDATSISLLEAMAYGCIPVVSNLPANLEWVIDGFNGIVVDDLDNDFFGRALSLDHAFVSNINGRLIAAKGSSASNREKYLSLYRRLLTSTKPLHHPEVS